MRESRRFRKKPVEVDAWQWNGRATSGERPEWLNGSKVSADYFEGVLRNTLEGIMTASAGDWIIRGTEGELYPCKPGIFESIYEPA